MAWALRARRWARAAALRAPPGATGLRRAARAAKDATRAQDLDVQCLKLQAALKMTESQFAEQRRADHAASKQREKNFQAAIVSLQLELETARGEPPQLPPQLPPPPTPAAAATTALLVAPREPSAEAAGTQPSEAAEALRSELASLRARVPALQEKCDRGVALIERLKGRLLQQEKDKEASGKKYEEIYGSKGVEGWDLNTTRQLTHSCLRG